MRTHVRHTEYRLLIPGSAVSFRSPNAKEYKDTIGKIAASVFDEGPTESLVEVRIDYFHGSQRRCDMDNVAKCLLDALNGIAYVDDKQVKMQVSREHDYSAYTYVRGVPVDVIKPLQEHPEYVFVRVRAVNR